MKYIIIILFSGIIFLGVELRNTYNEISKLGSVIDNLKVSNTKLKTKNKTLITKQQKIHNKIIKRRQSLSTANIKKAKRKLASAGAKMIPFLGIAVITSATAYDIKDYCKDIDEMEKFEYDLFGSKDLANYDKTVCGIDVEEKLAETEIEIESQYNQTLKAFNEEKDSLKKNFMYYINYGIDYFNNSK